MLGGGATEGDTDAVDDGEADVEVAGEVTLEDGEVVCPGVCDCPGDAGTEGDTVEAITPSCVSAVELEYDSEPANVA